MKTRNGNQSRWRKSRKRGVSPIIATILLVAITVVLAAVLYVLISGLTRGPGNTPLGSALATSSATAGTSCTPDCWYNFSIQSASTGLDAADMKFQLQNAAGSIVGFTGVSLIDVSGCVVGTYVTATGWGAVSGWAHPAPTACASLTSTSQVSSGDELVLETSSATSISSSGYTLVIIGTGSYSGTVTATIP